MCQRLFSSWYFAGFGATILVFSICGVIVGVLEYRDEILKEKIYRIAICTVKSIPGCYDKTCFIFDGEGISYAYTCYSSKWFVSYYTESNETETIYASIFGRKPYSTCDKAIRASDQHQLHSSDFCFYNQTNTHEVQWEKPNSLPSFIILIGCFLLIFIGIVVCVIYLKNTSSHSHRSVKLKTTTNNRVTYVHPYVAVQTS
ncbi:hypothetical protein I4U23_016327 [Adineta vaga]|nr:hypothetical protein I4U23_016327 [Adineta vaga]